MGDLPVVMVKKIAGVYSFYPIHADHLNVPRIILNTANVAVWRWDNSDAFGLGSPNQDPDGDGTAITYNLRFPGQYYDKETGLHYNYFRDYDPNTGRYLESDPIGLAGGMNTYGYVGGNPVNLVDPTGKNPIVLIPYIVPAAGAGAVYCSLFPDKCRQAAQACVDAIDRMFNEADDVQEEYDSLEACVGCVNPLDEVEYEGKTKNQGLRDQGYTEKWTGIDSNGTYQSGFKNPNTGKWTGGHESSKNNKYW